MASHENLTEREGRSRRRLPSDQDKEMKKDGRIKRFLCNVLQLRVLVYITTQPASFLFILSLLVIALCLPFLGAYIKTKSLQQLPDLDSMRHWNAYIGDLQEKAFCWTGNVSDDECPNDRHDQHKNNYTNKTIGVWMEFYVGKNFLKKPKQDDESSQEEKPPENMEGHLVAALTGSDLETRISSNGIRVDRNITVAIHVDLSKVNMSDPRCGGDCYPVDACVFITAPISSVPLRRPYIHEDFNFGKLSASSSQVCNCSDLSQATSSKMLTFDTTCDDTVKMKPAPEKFRHHGLITVYLNKGDPDVASQRITLSTVFLIGVALAFALAITCTDRPPKLKPSTE